MAIAPGQLWIDNSWQPAASGESFDTPDDTDYREPPRESGG